MGGRLLMIGLDATEPSLIESWIDAGALPNLAAIRRNGAYGRLASTAEWYPGSPWPAFYTGRPPGETGFYHDLMWQPDLLTYMRGGRHLPLEPFWYGLSRLDVRVVVFDVPLQPDPVPFNGVAINGWANTELLGKPSCYPADALARVDRLVPRPRQKIENYRLETFESLRDISLAQTALTRRIGDASASLLRAEGWDVAIVALHPPHLAGHKLWDETNLAGEIPLGARTALPDLLRAVYAACDETVGRLVEAAGPGTDVLVFSLHGMGPNTCRTDRLGEMLRRITDGQHSRPASRDRLAGSLRQLLPQDLRFAVKSRLPQNLRDRLTVYWRTGTRDWTRTRAFNVFSDLRGYVRVNLKGREAQGQVAPGPEAEALIEEIVDGLGSFVDADSGEPILASHATVEQLAPIGERRHLLPDLVLRWSNTPAAQHRRITSSRFGDIAWPTPGRVPTGRSGSHRGQGFVLAQGPRLDGRISVEGAHIVDLAPTVHAMLGITVPPTFAGRSLLTASA